MKTVDAFADDMRDRVKQKFRRTQVPDPKKMDTSEGLEQKKELLYSNNLSSIISLNNFAS